MPGLTEEARQVAAAYGVATGYVDWLGVPQEVSPETVAAVLAAMEVDVSSPDAAASALRSVQKTRWRRMLPPCVVVEEGDARAVWVHVPHGQAVQLWVDLEAGGRRDDVRQVDRWVEPVDVGDGLVGEATFELPPDLPLGYHALQARSGSLTAAATLIVTPAWVGLPESMAGRRGWGFAAQLYSVRSRRSWGVGDLVDLTDLAVWSGAQLGADYLLVNPLHAAEPVAPMEPSPYLPSSRRFFNPMYLRVERIPEYADLGPAERVRLDGIREGLSRALGRRDAIDRDTSWTAKRAALELVHAVPRTVGREADHRAFRVREGAGLHDFAVWSAVAEVHGADYRSWPEPLQDGDSAEVAMFAEQHAASVELHIWLQWLMDEQLQVAQAKASGAGMAIGVMHDLAVGVHPGGADAWRLRDTYAQGVQVGAPPDAYSQLGQNWSQPPWRPDRLAETGYLPLRQLLATVLRHAGGIRVDHVIGLFRLWWIPPGCRPSEGTYVTYDHEALIGVLALEAHRAGAVVVGEDLGLVEPRARGYLAGRGILGTSILWFEMAGAGQPLPAKSWREYCMASVTTHDLPPTAGYLMGAHVRLRDELGLLTRPLEEELDADAAGREAWLLELQGRGLVAPGACVEEMVLALHRYLALSPARLLCLGLPDAVGDKRIQNQPGTTDEYPNWRVPLSGPDGIPILLEDIIESARAARLTHTVSGQAPAAPSVAPQ